jgi:hypothetical protein
MEKGIELMETEIKLSIESGMRLLNQRELRIVLHKASDLLMYGVPTRIEFIYNTELKSLSVNFRTRDDLVSWYLFSEDKLNKPALEAWIERLARAR